MAIVIFALILSVLVFVHELGHFLAAKKSGIKVEEFGFGLPPRIIGKKIGETIYSINWLPIGGFVRLLGENGDEKINEKSELKRSFYHQRISKRFLVLVAGVVMNILLGVVCFSVLYTKVGIPTPSGRVTIVGVLPNSPADQVGLKENETVYRINGGKITDSQTFIAITKGLTGEEIELEVGDDSSTRVVKVIPRVSPPAGEGPLGVAISDIEMVHYPWWKMPYLVVREGAKEAFGWSGDIIVSLKNMLAGLILHGSVPQDVAGPVGIYQITKQAAQAGWLAVVQFVGVLSINLAVINILPLPALDGGRLVFLGYEVITRRKPNQKVEGVINNIGMLVLIGLMVLITVKDVLRLLN